MTNILPSTEPISNSDNPVQNVTPPIDTVPTSTALDGAPKKRNYLPWILGTLVLVVILSASFLIINSKSKSTPAGPLQPPVSQKQTTVVATDIDTSNWRTYANHGFGITLQYPSNWTVNMDDRNAVITIKADPTDRSIGIEISSLNKQNYISANHWLTQQDIDCEEAKQLSEKTGGPTDCFQYKRLGERNINQNISPKILWNCCGAGPTIRYFIESKDKVYFIDLFQDWENLNLNTIGDYDEDNSKLAIIYQQILSTFKFTDTTTNQINLTLPTGWTKSVERANNPFDDRKKYEQTVLAKGNYKIEIGEPTGENRDACGSVEPRPASSTLNNPSLSLTVERTNTSNYPYAADLYVCSDFKSKDKNDLDYGTKIGMIKYILPSNWDQAVLKEMDSIVESITLTK